MTKQSLIALKITLVLLLMTHLAMVVINHLYYKTYGYDYAAYNFAFYDYAHLRISPVPIYGQDYPITFIQDHYSLTLIILSPLYWVFNPVFGTMSLLIIQFLLITAGCIATYKLIKKLFGQELYGLLAAIFYLILYSRFSAYQNDCNLVIMGSALVPVFWYWFDSKRYLKSLLVFTVILVNREDFPLGLTFLCFCLAVMSEDKKQARIAYLLSAVALIMFFVNMKFILPALEDEHKKFSNFNYSALGKTAGEAVLFAFSHPIKTLMLFWQNAKGDVVPEKISFYWLFLCSGGALLLVRPVLILPLLPLLAKKMFNDDLTRNGVESYYSIEIMSILPILIFFALSVFKRPRFRKVLSVVVVLSATATTAYFLQTSLERKPDIIKFDPFCKLFYQTDGFSRSHLNYMVSQIPDTAIVTASGRICPHLSNRPKVYYFSRISDAQYILVFTKIDTWPMSSPEVDEAIKNIITSGEWNLQLADADIFLLKRK